MIEIATILHNGAVVDVSDKMRRFFGMMARKHSLGQTRRPWRPIKRTTKVIVIPKRPFLEEAVTSKLIRMYQENWERAVESAMAGK